MKKLLKKKIEYEIPHKSYFLLEEVLSKVYTLLLVESFHDGLRIVRASDDQWSAARDSLQGALKTVSRKSGQVQNDHQTVLCDCIRLQD